MTGTPPHLQLDQELEAGRAGHEQVHEDDIHRGILEGEQGLPALGGFDDLVPLTPQRLPQGGAEG